MVGCSIVRAAMGLLLVFATPGRLSTNVTGKMECVLLKSSEFSSALVLGNSAFDARPWGDRARPAWRDGQPVIQAAGDGDSGPNRGDQGQPSNSIHSQLALRTASIADYFYSSIRRRKKFVPEDSLMDPINKTPLALAA